MSDSEASDEVLPGGEQESSSFTGTLPRTTSLSAAKFTHSEEKAPPGFDEHKMNGTAERQGALNGDGRMSTTDSPPEDVRMTPPADGDDDEQDDRMSAVEDDQLEEDGVQEEEEEMAQLAAPEDEMLDAADEAMVPISPPAASPNRFLIDKKTLPILLTLTEQFKQQRISWCNPLPLPNNVLIATLDQVSDIIRNGLDLPGSEAENQVFVILESVMGPVFERICRDETGMNNDDMKNMMSCIFRFLVIFVNKLHKSVSDGYPLPGIYWILFQLCTEYNNRFFTRVSQYQMSSILPIVPGDLTLPSSIIRKPQSGVQQTNQWFIATIVWFHKLRGFDALISYFHSRVDGSSAFVEIAPFLDSISGYLQFLEPHFIRTTLDPILDVVMSSLEGVTEDVWTKQSFIEFRDCPTYRMAQFVRSYLNYGKAGGDVAGDYEKAKKAAQLKLLFLKKCVLLGSFNVKMCAMDDLCRMLQLDEAIVDMNADDLQAWIRQIELVETLFKDNLHHLAYIERLNRAVNTLLDRGVLSESFLDVLWQAQQGKHDVIQRNMQHIIAKVVVVFNEQLLNAFWDRIADSWQMGSYKDRETVVDLLRRVGLENFIQHDHTLIKFPLVEHILKLIWHWSSEPGFDGNLRRRIYEAIIDILGETVSSPKGVDLLQRMCVLVANSAVVSNDPVGNGDDPTALLLTLMRRILELFSEGDPRYGEYINKRSDMLKILDDEYQTDGSLPPDFSFGKMIVNGICDFVDGINIESAEPSVCSDSSMDSECSSVDSSEDESQSVIILTTALRTRLDFVEFLLQIVQRSMDYDANPFENEWAKKLWNKLITTKQPQKLQNAGFGFFANMISWSDVMEHGDSFIVFFREKVMSVAPTMLSVMGFHCFEAFLRVANIVLNKMKVDVTQIGTAEEKEYHLLEPDFEGEEYLRKAVVFGTDKVFHKALTLLVKLWATRMHNTVEKQQQFVSEVVGKFTAWLSEVERDGVDDGKNNRDMRIRRVLQTINEIVDRNEADSRLIHRAYPILRRAILGKGIRINIIFKVEEMQLLFPDQRVPLNTNKPLVLVVHENLLLYDLVKHVCGVITNQGGTITPYALMLVRKGGSVPGGNNRFGAQLRLGDWSQTLKELQIEEHTHLVARADKSRLGEDGSGNDYYVRQTSEEWCYLHEKRMYAYQLIHDEELLSRIVALGNDCELIETCTRLFCSIPMARIGDFDRMEPWETKVQRFRKFLAELMAEQSSSRRLCGFLQLYEALLPATLPYKNNNETLTAFFAASGPTALIKMFSQYADLDCLDELAVLNCDVLLRILPQIVYLFIASIAAKLESRISNAALDFFYASKKYADFLVQDMGTLLILPQEREYLLNEMVMDVDERDLFAFIHIGMKFMHDTARSCVLSSLLDVPMDPEALLDPMIEDPDKMVSACVYVFSFLASYSDHGYTVLGSPIFHNFLLEVCSEEDSTSDLSMMLPVLLCEVEKDRESTALLEAAIAFLFEHLDTQNILFWNVICSMINKYTELSEGVRLPFLSERVEEMVSWLDAVQKQTEETMCHYPAQHLLCGRLKLCATLFGELTSAEKAELGVAEGGSQLVERLLYNFLVPSSRAFAQKLWQEGSSRIVRSQTLMETLSAPSNEMDSLSAVPRSASSCVLPISTVSVCKSDGAQRFTYDVLKILCENSECLAQLVKILKELFYTDRTLDDIVWDYQPDYSLRLPENFVGLKNGGATCYMNSILQQLYMISQMRDTILNASVEEDHEDMPYETRIVGALQSVFAHLAGSELEAYTPDEFWRIFKLNERIVNVHEQQDAFEFFNMVVDLIDEGMEKIGSPKIGSQVFGGLFADEKICKDCPHKYSRDEPFTSISIDVRSHNNIVDSLHEFVKGDVLENDNAYHCESCNKKVRAVKRLSIKKLPANLVVQLKRFEFDWEKNEPVKFNDYFEFPFSLDMRPYTADALNALDTAEAGESPSSPTPLDSDCQYNLRGVLVHSGQATGGHYFSYIRNDDGKWFKFDDNDVSPYECDQRDVKYKWFGDDPSNVDYTGRRRGRIWWNAFLLFYEKVSTTTLVDRNLATLLPVIQPPVIPMSPLSVDPLLAQAVDSSRRSSTASPVTRLHKRFSTMSLMSNRLRNIPPRLEKQVRNQNTRIMHERNQYNVMFFGFITSLVKHHLVSRLFQKKRNKEVYLLLTDLYSNFLIYTCLHSSALLRKETEYDTYQPHNAELFSSRFDWCEAIVELIRSKPSRLWFINNVVLSEHATRIYCLAAKDAEIRLCYARMLARVLETCFHEGDTIADLLQYKSAHLHRLMQPKYTKDLEQPAIQLLADTLTALIRSIDKPDKSVEMYHTVVNIVITNDVPNKLFLHFLRAGMLSNLLRLLQIFAAPYLQVLPCHAKLACLMIRCIDMMGPQPDGSRNPFIIMPPELALSLADLPDHKQYLREMDVWTRDDLILNSRLIEHLVLSSWEQPENDWMKNTVCYYCWNNKEIANRLINLAVHLTLQDRHSTHTETGLQVIHMLCHLPDQNNENCRRFKYIFNEVPYIYQNEHYERRDYTVGPADLYGLRSIVYIANVHKRETLLRALVIVLEAYESRAIQYIKQQDRARFDDIITITRMEIARSAPNPLTLGRGIPNIMNAKLRMNQFISRFQEAPDEPQMDESMDDDFSSESGNEMEQPLDLTLARNSATTPQAAEKRTLPAQDDTDSLNGEGEAKKSRIVSAVVDDEKLLADTSISATDLREKNSQNPPPGYSET